MRRHDDRGGRAFDRELLKHQRIRDVVEARAAVLLRQEDAQHPEPREFVDCFTGIPMRAIGLDADWPELLASEASRNIARAALRFSEFEIHRNSFVA